MYGHLVELGVADPLADGLVAVVDLDAVPGVAQPVGERVRGVAVRVADRDDAHLHGREPEREGAAVVLDQDPDEALERAEQRAVDDARDGARCCRRPT